jgi:hypothetical protein
MKKIVITLNILFLLFVTVFAEQQVKYFQVDKVKTIRGEITDIKTEKSYHKNDFIVIYLKVKEKTGEEIYRVEVSPEWFFAMDLMKGGKIEVTGSYSTISGQGLMMTQSITFQGEKYEFRDKYGFPLWRGKGKFMKQGFRKKGKRKRRGRH